MVTLGSDEARAREGITNGAGAGTCSGTCTSVWEPCVCACLTASHDCKTAPPPLSVESIETCGGVTLSEFMFGVEEVEDGGGETGDDATGTARGVDGRDRELLVTLFQSADIPCRSFDGGR